MPSWSSLVDEVKAAGTTYDLIRRKYLRLLNEHTGRNVIVYYSGWLQKGHLMRLGATGFEVNDLDKNGLMATIHELERADGLDLLLHTPGGDFAATESLVEYLRDMFDDVRAIVPQLAMSAGTMIALACSEIVMGKHSSLGPIDPQVNGRPAHAVIEEFNRAAKEIKADPTRIAVWQPIIAKYTPTTISACEKAIAWSKEVVQGWLETGMLSGEPEDSTLAAAIVEELGDHSIMKSHSRHVSLKKATELGLKVTELEADQQLQELVLSVHHACTLTLSDTPTVKLIENHRGVAHTQTLELPGA